ncbi:hypothetical protein ACN47E_001857 [Coniothyrium glycines]
MTDFKAYELPFRGVENDTSYYSRLRVVVREIRIIQLEKGQRDEPLVCRLRHVQVDSPGQTATASAEYEALSYCWGDADDTLDIQLRFPNSAQNSCDSKDHTTRVFRITRNLEHALRALRLANTERSLWVDALCINQGDVTEKKFQVSMMNVIYATSKRVVVWLGKEDIYSRFFIRFSEVYSKYNSECDPIELDNKDHVKQIAKDEMLSSLLVELEGKQHHLSSKFHRSLHQISRRPWFKRVWVYQEIFLAPSTSDEFPDAIIAVGPFTMPWKDFTMAARAIISTYLRMVMLQPESTRQPSRYGWDNEFSLSYGWSKAPAADRQNRLQNVIFHGSWLRPDLWDRQESFNDALRSTLTFEASDPRDKLFALLHVGLDTREQMSLVFSHLVPDYSKSLQQIILDFSLGQVYLPLSICMHPAEKEAIYQHGHDPTHQVSFEFTWQYTQSFRRKTEHTYSRFPRVHPDIGPAVSAHIVSVIVERHDLDWDKIFVDDRPVSTLQPRDPDLWRAERFVLAVFKLCKSCHPTDTEDQLLHRMLALLGIEPQRQQDWLRLTRHCLSDTKTLGYLFSPPHIALSTASPFLCLDNPGVTIWALHEYLATVPRKRTPTAARSAFFTDSRGRLLMSHAATSPGDLVVLMPGTDCPFVMSSIETHMPLARDLAPLRMPKPRKSLDSEVVQAFLFFGVCVFYPADCACELATGHPCLDVPPTLWGR